MEVEKLWVARCYHMIRSDQENCIIEAPCMPCIQAKVLNALGSTYCSHKEYVSTYQGTEVTQVDGNLVDLPRCINASPTNWSLERVPGITCLVSYLGSCDRMLPIGRNEGGAQEMEV